MVVFVTDILLEKHSKEYFTTNEASKANLNADKRILKSPPFLHRVYSVMPLGLTDSIKVIMMKADMSSNVYLTCLFVFTRIFIEIGRASCRERV